MQVSPAPDPQSWTYTDPETGELRRCSDPDGREYAGKHRADALAPYDEAHADSILLPSRTFES